MDWSKLFTEERGFPDRLSGRLRELNELEALQGRPGLPKADIQELLDYYQRLPEGAKDALEGHYSLKLMPFATLPPVAHDMPHAKKDREWRSSPYQVRGPWNWFGRDSSVTSARSSAQDRAMNLHHVVESPEGKEDFKRFMDMVLGYYMEREGRRGQD